MKKIICIILSVLTVAALCSMCISAEDNYEYLADKTETVYNEESGLITGKANDIAQLEDGSIWIGQYAGLTRYDGATFSTYYQSKDGINVTAVVSLLAVENKLYVGTQRGLVLYENSKFEEIKLSNDVLCVNDIFYYDDVVYVGTSGGVYEVFNDKTVSKVNGENIISITSSKQGTYYVTSDYGVFKLDGTPYYSEKSIKTVFADDSHVYLGGVTGELIIDGKETAGSTDAQKPINVIREKDSLVYIASDNGLYLYDGKTFTHVDGLQLNSGIEGIAFDYQGSLWLASTSLGVSKISPNYFTDMFFKYNVEHSTVTSVEYYGKLLYVSTETGLVIIDEVSRTRVVNELTEMLDGIRLRDLEVFDGKLYIATYDTDLFDIVVYDGKNIEYIAKEALVEEGETSVNKAGQIRVLKSSGSALFIGTNYGISRLDSDGIKTVKTTNRPLYLYVQNSRVYACFENGGLGLYEDDLKFVKILEGSESKTPLKCCMTSVGLLYNHNSELYVYFDGKSQPVNINIIGTVVEIFEYRDKIYIGADTGIYIIDKKSVFLDQIEYDLIDKNSGLISSLQSNASGYFDKQSSMFYFACRDTCYLYSLDGSQIPKTPIKIGFNGIVVDGISYSDPNVKISKDTERITINVSYYNFLTSGKYTVKYRLDGFEAEYHEASLEDIRSITYTNLRGGRYTFMLYVVDEDGFRSNNELKIVIDKEQKLIEMTWFVIVIIVVGIMLIVFIMLLITRSRTKRLIKQKNAYKAITLESIEAIARTIDAKDHYTNGHSTRVGAYSRMIAESLGLSQDEVENIYYIALLHDIGKISVPDNILNKPGKLTDEEFAIMKAHTENGDKILASISTIPNICEGARHHHEKYGGGGYPDGLIGDQIPFVARIICCADCFDAMATKRTYKEPYPLDKIISEFERCSGTQFDPEIAKKVIELIKAGKLEGEYKFESKETLYGD